MYTGETDRAKGCHWERGRELERETDRAERKVVTVTIATAWQRRVQNGKRQSSSRD